MSDILDLIDNAIEASESWPDAMRWTPETPAPAVYDHVADGMAFVPGNLPEISFGFRRELPPGHFTILDETHTWTAEFIRHLEELLGMHGMRMTTWQRQILAQGAFHRAYLNDEVPSGLSRESNPASTERPTDG